MRRPPELRATGGSGQRRVRPAVKWMSTVTQMQQHARTATEPLSALTNTFLETWVSWRESCENVGSAYRSWSECARSQRSLAFADYRAALDREQVAASIHADAAWRIRALGP